MNGSYKAYAYRDEDDGHDTVTTTAQFKLEKGDTVNVFMSGYYYDPASSTRTYFEGHLIRQINE